MAGLEQLDNRSIFHLAFISHINWVGRSSFSL